MKKSLKKSSANVLPETSFPTSLTFEQISVNNLPSTEHEIQELDTRLDQVLNNLGIPEKAKSDMKKLPPDKKWDLVMQNQNQQRQQQMQNIQHQNDSNYVQNDINTPKYISSKNYHPSNNFVKNASTNNSTKSNKSQKSQKSPNKSTKERANSKTSSIQGQSPNSPEKNFKTVKFYIAELQELNTCMTSNILPDAVINLNEKIETLIDSLKTSLRTEPSQFTFDFINHQGFSLLLNFLQNLPDSTSNNLNPKHLTGSYSASTLKNGEEVNLKESRIHVGLLSCIKSLLNDSFGRKHILSHPNGIGEGFLRNPRQLVKSFFVFSSASDFLLF